MKEYPLNDSEQLQLLNRIAYCRFESIDQIKDKLKELSGLEINLFESESNKLEGNDHILDGEFILNEEKSEYNPFTIYYLKDTVDRYFITEV